MAFFSWHETLQWASIFVTFLLWVFTIIPVNRAERRAGGRDNSNPRQAQQLLDESGQRALAAQTNTFEALVFFAAAVTTSQLGGGNTTVGDVLCIAFLVARILFLIFYYFNIPALRSLSWSISMMCIVGLFINPFATPNS